MTKVRLINLSSSGQQLHPRRLTVAEIQTNSVIPIEEVVEELMTESNETMTEEAGQDNLIPLGHLAIGTNEEKSGKDVVRMPGTKWCGPGWRTDKAMKFGGYAGTDRCCRHHDLACPIMINPGETHYGLFNDKFHSVMHCSCDDRFRSCLKMVHNQAADIVGNLFFNLAKTPCFIFKREEVCKSRNWWGQCLKLETKEVAMWRKSLAY